MINENVIPHGFNSWNHFYQGKVVEALKKYPDCTTLKFQQLTVSLEFNYEFTIDFIKAKCFDEFLEEWPKLCGQIDPWEQTPASCFEVQIEKFLCITTNTRLL